MLHDAMSRFLKQFGILELHGEEAPGAKQRLQLLDDPEG